MVPAPAKRRLYPGSRDRLALADGTGVTMITIDDTLKRFAPDLVVCDELERRLDIEIERMKPGPRACASIEVGANVDVRAIYVTLRKYERAGYIARTVAAAAGGGCRILVRLGPADEAAVFPFGF
jgi:hypothetical protein